MTNPSSSKMASPRSLSPCSEAERAYRATCTLPAMPKKCPDCAGKVKLCHINIETNESVIMCPDTKCSWPFSCEKKYEEFSGYSDSKLYQKWQEELKKKKRRKKEASSGRRASSVSSGTDGDAVTHSDKTEPTLKSGSNIEKSQISIFDVQEEKDPGPPNKDSEMGARDDEKAPVPDKSNRVKPSTSPVAGEERDNDNFLLPERPVSVTTPRRRDNSFSASDNEDYGDISDAEPDLNLFRYGVRLDDFDLESRFLCC